MKQIFLIFSISLLFNSYSFASPARMTPIEVTQKDGEKLSIILHGDEFFHYFLTEDEIPVVQGEDLSYYYASVSNGNLINSGILAHNKNGRSNQENTYITTHLNNAIHTITNKCDSINSINVELFNKSMQRRIAANGSPQNNYTGKKKGLIILVNFADTSMQGENPNEAFNHMFNEHGYNENNHIGSVRDYFYDQSYGKFELSFDVVGPVTVSRELAYYGRNNSLNDNTDVNVRDMVVEACQLADDYVDFSDYDWNGDGEAEQIFFVYAGYGEASGAPSYTIWPHKSIITYSQYPDPFILDNTVINTYACTCELAGTSGNTPNGIGTACHEFSHCLGLPDLYDVNYRGGFGMDVWDVMDSGSYSGPDHYGEVPCGYSAYERWFAGWLDYHDLNEMERIYGMECIADDPVAYRIVNDNHADEYFVLENRQNERWFTFAGTSTECHGLLITHVDYSAPSWTLNSVNTAKNHQRVSIVPADNDYGQFYSNGSTQRYNPTAEDLEGDLFPGSHNVTEFTGISHENVGGRLFNETDDGSFFLAKPVTNIKEANGVISFDFMGGIFVVVPAINGITATSENSFSISWESDGATDYFIAEATEIKEKSPTEYKLLSENFTNFTTEQGSPDGILDVSIHMDSYTDSKGWKGKNLHTSPLGAKIGNKDYGGFITTPAIPINRNSMTVEIKGMITGNLILTTENNDTTANRILEIRDNNSAFINFDDIDNDAYSLSVVTDSDSCYVSKITVYDGAYSKDDLSFYSILQYLKPAETITATEITGNSYTFENLNAKKYKCRIRASYDEAMSEWTDYAEIDLCNFNGIDDIIAEGNKPYCVYDISGKKVRDITSPGVYIIDYGTHKRKILRR